MSWLSQKAGNHLTLEADRDGFLSPSGAAKTPSWIAPYRLEPAFWDSLLAFWDSLVGWALPTFPILPKRWAMPTPQIG